MRKSKAVVCFSGGADSTTVLYLALQECDEVHAFSVDYGQRHKKELDCTKEIVKRLGIPHKIVQFDLTSIGGSPLTDKLMDIPNQDERKQGTTVVPYRNMLLATLAAAYARTNGLNIIYMGPTYEDLENYPDCRPAFFESLQKTLRLGDKIYDLIIRTPFIRTTKDEIIRIGKRLNVDYSKTWTCYAGKDYPCLKCDACRERMWSFRANCMKDPLVKDEDWTKYLKEKI